MEKKPVIQFTDFSFRYRSQQKPTLKNISLTIYEGEKVLILGPSGCGKSTLASCINGLIPHSHPGEISGSCKVAGVEVKDTSIFQISKTVGTVLQDSDGQFVGLSVGEDIAYALENDNMPRSEMIPKVYEAAKIVGMEDFLDHVPYELSGGQKQRVALAGIMHGDVSVLLFDEPLAALDPSMGMFAIDLIDRIQKETNKTVVIIEHRLEDVLYRDIDRIILMNDGTIVADMTPNELLSSDMLAAYGVREPLYISALKNAHCDLKGKDLENIETMDLEPFKDNILKEFESVRKNEVFVDPCEVLDVKGVSYSYNSITNVLEDISFTVHKGEKIALIGKNGAGKSTLAKVLCGICRPTEGSVEINGINYVEYSIKELGEKIGYVMQNPNQMLVKDMIKDEVSLALTLHNKSEEEITERVNEALKMCNLYTMRNWPVNSLSYGQKKRVTIASILALKPDVMILDEPTAGQDYKCYTEIMSFLEELNERSKITILFITHDMHLAIEYTDRAIVFSDGHLLMDDSVFKVLSNNEIIEKASLKQTSLYTLAKRLGIPVEDYISHFIAVERSKRNEQ